jgi:hypothetical protein
VTKAAKNAAKREFPAGNAALRQLTIPFYQYGLICGVGHVRHSLPNSGRYKGTRGISRRRRSRFAAADRLRGNATIGAAIRGVTTNDRALGSATIASGPATSRTKNLSSSAIH